MHYTTWYKFSITNPAQKSSVDQQGVHLYLGATYNPTLPALVLSGQGQGPRLGDGKNGAGCAPDAPGTGAGASEGKLPPAANAPPALGRVDVSSMLV